MNTTNNMIVVWCLVAAMLLQQAAALTNLRHAARALQEDISFRLQVEKDSDWCVECELHSSSSGSRCREGDKLVIDKCGSSARQRFIMDGKRISPQVRPGNACFHSGMLYANTLASWTLQGNPDLCLQRSGNDVRLRDCSSSVSRQRWYGVDKDDPFELFQGSGGSDDDSESLGQCNVHCM
jgi:hypothetical protein